MNSARFSFVFAIWAFILCNLQAQSPSSNPTPTLEERVKALEEKVEAIENNPAIAMMLHLQGFAEANATPEAKAAPQTDSPLELLNWQYQFKTGQYEFQNRHMFTYVLKNRTDKAIKLVDGNIVFTDLLGEKLMTIRLLPDVSIPAGGFAPSNGEWQVNTYEPNQLRLKNLSHEDIKATLAVEKVVFSDNTIWSAGTQAQH